MPNSFRYLLAVTGLVALLFAAISAWPLFNSWLRNRSTPAPQPPPIVSVPMTPQSTGVTGQPARSPAKLIQVQPLPAADPAQAASQANSLPPNATNVRQMSSQRYVPGSWTTGDGVDSLGWCYARDTVTLYNRPKGDPLVPITLNRCPLTVAKGTRLGMIRQEGSWLLVNSKFSTTGWVHEQDVSEVKLADPPLQ